MSTVLHVLTYNTHLFTGTMAAKLGSVLGNVEFEDERRLSGIIEKIKLLHPDLVGLTEVWGRKSRQRVIEELEPLYPHSYSDELRGGLKVGSGLLLLSRHPLSNPSFTGYKTLRGSDGWSNKGFITATIHVGGQNVLVALTHTQASADDAATKARWTNLTALQGLLQRAELAHLPMIVLGDLNVSGECLEGKPTREYQDMSGLMAEVRLQDAFRQTHPVSAARGFTWDGENNPLVGYFDKQDGKSRLQQRLDYLFVRGLRPSACNVLTDFVYRAGRSGQTMDLSDHYPLYAALTLPRQ